jgi:beta-lactamase class A
LFRKKEKSVFSSYILKRSRYDEYSHSPVVQQPQPVAADMNLLRIVSWLCSLLFLVTSSAVAAPPKNYALAYSWHKDVQRSLDDRARLARSLSLSVDRHLQILGKGAHFGVVYPMNGTLAQTRKLALAQSQKLELAGFSPPEIILQNTCKKLYHLQLVQSNDLQRLHDDYQRFANHLPPKDRHKLRIEKTGARSYALVFHSWADKATATQLARRHGKLSKKQSPPILIAAVTRPNVPPMVSIATTKSPTKAAKTPKPCKVAVAPVGTTTPLISPDQAGIALPETGKQTTALNSQIQNFLREQRSKGKLQRQEKTALVVYDLANSTYLASINAQRPFQAASMIKPFVALAFFHQVDKGKLHYTAKHRRMMEEMIQLSNNEATNWFIRQLGGPARCNGLINREYGRLFRQVRIIEYIPPGGKTYKNSALPQDYIQYLKALWNKKLPYSDEMLRVMSLPGRDRIYWGTRLPPGTTAHLCGDMGILITKTKDGRRIPYAIVGIVERSTVPKNYHQWMVKSGKVIRDFSSLVYSEMKDRYNLL